MAKLFALFSIISLLASAPLAAQEPSPPPEPQPEAPAAVTTGDPTVEPAKLDLMLAPLTRAELEVEAEAWLGILADNVRAVSELALAEGEGEGINALRESKLATLDRFRVVLDELDAKGGDSTEMRAYGDAVSDAQVNVADKSQVWSAMTSWLTSKEGGIKWGLMLLKFLVILFIFWLIARAVRRVVRKAAEKSDHFSELLEQFVIKMSFRIVMFIGLLVGLATLGVNVGAMFALIGGASFIIGFALQDTLGNFANGVMLLIYRPFDVGDAVEVGGVGGKIDNVSLVSTTIRTFDNKVVLVPNKKVWGEVITNASASATRRVDMVFGIGYDDDIEKAKGILERIVAENEMVLDDPEPTIQLHELADSSVNFICRPWTKTGDYWDVFWNVTGRVKEEFDKAGISIPYPQQDVHIHQVAS